MKDVVEVGKGEHTLAAGSTCPSNDLIETFGVDLVVIYKRKITNQIDQRVSDGGLLVLEFPPSSRLVDQCHGVWDGYLATAEIARYRR